MYTNTIGGRQLPSSLKARVLLPKKDGYSEPVTVLLSGSPNPNEVAIADAVNGVLEFNAADVGKNVNGTVTYLQKIHPTEVL